MSKYICAEQELVKCLRPVSQVQRQGSREATRQTHRHATEIRRILDEYHKHRTDTTHWQTQPLHPGASNKSTRHDTTRHDTTRHHVLYLECPRCHCRFRFRWLQPSRCPLWCSSSRPCTSCGYSPGHITPLEICNME
jgi:hypothetical protein